MLQDERILRGDSSVGDEGHVTIDGFPLLKHQNTWNFW